MSTWDEDFIIMLDTDMLFAVINAANYLDIKGLMCVWSIKLTFKFFPNYLTHRDIGCKRVANMIKGKTPEEIRKMFNIVNDFTPEEEVSLFLRSTYNENF